jgi:hypothetical protein
LLVRSSRVSTLAFCAATTCSAVIMKISVKVRKKSAGKTPGSSLRQNGALQHGS